jgi:hypothetical protein
MTAIALELAADGRRSAMQLRRNQAQRYAGRCALEISSRSTRLSARRDRRRGASRMPPCGFKCWKIAPEDRSISFSPSPRRQRSQTSALSAN